MSGLKLFESALVICGIALFIHFWQLQRQFQAKLHAVQAGEVQPETLTVITKRAYTGGSGGRTSAQGWVVFRGSRQAEVVYPAPTDRELYQTVHVGSTVTGYYFPDGYFIPQYDLDRVAGRDKWIFSGFAIFMAAILFGLSHMSRKRKEGHL